MIKKLFLAHHYNPNIMINLLECFRKYPENISIQNLTYLYPLRTCVVTCMYTLTVSEFQLQMMF